MQARFVSMNYMVLSAFFIHIPPQKATTFSHLFYHPRRTPNCHTIVRHIFSNHRICTNYTMLSNFHISNDYCIDSNIGSIANRHRLSFLRNSLIDYRNTNVSVLMIAIGYVHVR